MEDEYLEQLNGVLNKTQSSASNTDPYLVGLRAHQEYPGRSSTGSVDFSANVGEDYGDSMFDIMTLSRAEFERYGNDTNELRAQNQPWIAKAGAGVGRFATKAVSEVLKMPGMIGGAIASPLMGGSAVENMFNNAWIRAIEDGTHYLQSEALPVYVKKAVKEGNLLDNILSVDFWATEAADGLGYIASMLVPGMAMSKVGLGTKMLRGMNRGASAMFKNAKNVEQTMKSLGITKGNIDVFNATLANTFFEAGAEAGNAMRTFEEEMNQKVEAGEMDPKEAEALKMKKAELGRNVFWDNVKILLGPNLILNKMMLGDINTTKGLKADDFFDGKKLVEKLPTPSTLQKAGKYGKSVIGGALREGFWEEGMQTTSELYRKGQLQGDDTSFLDTYIESAKTVEGQKAIFLGAIFGGPMNVYNTYKQDKAEAKAGNALLQEMKNAETFLNLSMSDIYKKKANGDYILDKDGNKIVDPNSESAFAEALQKLEDVDNLLDFFQEHGHENMGTVLNIEELKNVTGKELYNNLRDQLTSYFVLPFAKKGDVGIEVLEQYLTNMSDIVTKVEEYNEAFGTSLTEKQFKQEILTKAKKAQKTYEKMEGILSSVSPIESDTATREQKENFYSQMDSAYVANTLRKDYLESSKNKQQKILDEYVNELFSFEHGNKKLENFTAELAEKDNFYQTQKSLIDKKDAEIQDLNDFLKKFYDPKTVNSIFKKDQARRKKIEDLNKEENVKAADDAVKKVKGSKTEKELSKNTKEAEKQVPEEVKPVIKKEAEKQREKIEEQEEKEAQNNIRKLNNQKNAREDYEVGELVQIKDDKGNYQTYRVDLDDNGKLQLINIKTNAVERFASIGYSKFINVVKEEAVTEDETPEQVSEDNDNQSEHQDSLDIKSKPEGTVELWDSPKIFPTFHDFLFYNTENKVGQKVTFALNRTGIKRYDDIIKKFEDEVTYDKFKDVMERGEESPHFKLINDIIDHLPLKVIVRDGIETGLSGLPSKDQTMINRYYDFERRLREEIIESVLLNKSNATGTDYLTAEQMQQELGGYGLGLIQAINELGEGTKFKVLGVSETHGEVIMGYKTADGTESNFGYPIKNEEDFKALAKKFENKKFGQEEIDPFEGITSEIVYQSVKQLLQSPKDSEGRIPENSLMDMININSLDDIELHAVTNNLGETIDESGKKDTRFNFPNNNERKGNIILAVRQPNGKTFPLKLNVKRINEEDAQEIFKLVKGILNSSKTIPQVLVSDIFDNISESSLARFHKTFTNKDVKAVDLPNMIISDGGVTSSKYDFKFEGNNLIFGSNEVVGQAIDSFEKKIVNWITKNKRYNVNFDYLQSNKKADNSAYKALLVETKIINTDAAIMGPLFKFSNIHIKNTIINNPLQNQKKDVSLTASKETQEVTNQSLEDQISVEENFFNEDDIEEDCGGKTL